MKKMLLALTWSLVLMSAKSQSNSAISTSDIQYIKYFFTLNFIKSPISHADQTNRAQFNYEFTDDAIIIYKTELTQNAGSNTSHWYYLPLGNIRIKNYKQNLNYFKGAHAIWFEGIKGNLPHGIGKKFTKISDAVYTLGWLNLPFKYDSFGDLDKLKNILELPLQKNNVIAAAPVKVSKSAYNFTSSLVSNLYHIAAQLDGKNWQAVMKAEGYTLQSKPGDNTGAQHYSKKDKRTLILAVDEYDTATVIALKVPFLGIEGDDLMKDFKDNAVEYAGRETEANAEIYYFSAPDSGYVFRIEFGNNGWSNYVYLFKEIKIKKRMVVDDISGFKVYDMATITGFFDHYMSFTLKGKKYSAMNRKDMAAFFNEHMYKAANWDETVESPFAVLGKTDFSKKSIAFTVKDDQLFITLNLPLNGTCDYGLKEIPAWYGGTTTPVDKGTMKGYMATFQYKYSCQGKDYKYLTVYIADNEKVSFNIIKTYLQSLPE